MKKIIFGFIALVFLLLAVFYAKHKEETPAPDLTTSQQTQTYAVSQHTLTYTSGVGGTIDGSSPQIVNQGGDGSPVTAVPSDHYHFAGWSDGVTSASRTDHMVTADMFLTANFAIDRHTLIYGVEKGGTIAGADSQQVAYGGSGTMVKAAPAAGYHFLSWSDGVSTPDRTDSEVTADMAVTASFAVNQYTLTYTAKEHGAIEGVSPQTVIHGGDGRPVTAVPAEHYHFTGWSDGVTGVSRTDRKVASDLAVKANFALDQYTLTYIAAANGSIAGVNPQTVTHRGDGRVVTAVPAAGYHFVGWSDGVITPERTDTKVTADLTVTVNFDINQYTLIYEAGENGTINGPSSQTVEHGAAAGSVTAVANKGFHFVAWSDGVTTAQRIDSKLVGDLKISAIFAVNTYSVGGSVSGLAAGTQVVLQNNGEDDLVISADGPFKFATELRTASTYNLGVLSQPSAPNQICTVARGTGTISYSDVTDIAVTCVPVTYKIGGTVSGLPAGDQVVLRKNGRENLVVGANGDFAFATPLDDGSAYIVTVKRLPKRQNWTCETEKAAGVLNGQDVTDVVIGCFPKVVLQTTAGKRKIKLNWNSQDFSEVTFNLCFAPEEIASAGFSSCQAIKGGVLRTKVTNPLTISQPDHDVPYWFQLEASYASGRQTLSEEVIGMSLGGLNDSGIDWCTDESLDGGGSRAEKSKRCNNLAATYPGQDAVYGRDAEARDRKLTKTGNGSAGFDFTKICRSGKAAGEGKCPPNPMSGKGLDNWTCTRDNTTGLLWEIKTDSGLRSKNNTYTWFNPDDTVNGGDHGLKNGGICEGSGCDTYSYIQAINDLKPCGVGDWRLPTKRELLSIVDNARLNPAIDTQYFPNALSSRYWSSLPSTDQKTSAWQVYFKFGEASPNDERERNHVRLVHGRTVTFGLDNP